MPSLRCVERTSDWHAWCPIPSMQLKWSQSPLPLLQQNDVAKAGVSCCRTSQSRQLSIEVPEKSTRVRVMPPSSCKMTRSRTGTYQIHQRRRNNTARIAAPATARRFYDVV
ncbi:unnamed protein product [Ixodes pacificus]